MGTVRLVIKNVPYKERDYAYNAAMASLAARDQGKYWEMHDLLLDRSPHIAPDDILRYAKELGLDMDRFRRSMQSEEHKRSLERDLKLGDELHVYSTPTYFINGKKIVGHVPYSYLKKTIDKELAHANQPAQ